MAKVTELELKGIIHSEINNSIGFMGSSLTSQRKKSQLFAQFLTKKVQSLYIINAFRKRYPVYKTVI